MLDITGLRGEFKVARQGQSGHPHAGQGQPQQHACEQKQLQQKTFG